ncbi:MAG: PD40 domain-containing protein, partial [Acidobacteria bacterium]|nr:PD40 domain-containing protein [Acidobacteriota bacterium]
ILTIHEIGQASAEAGGTHFIATEFVAGETLRQRIACGRLPMAAALDVAMQVSAALSAAHEAGIIHRDIKPENIMLRRDGYVKVLDFGLAKLIEAPGMDSAEEAAHSAFTTTPGLVMGTPAYMSPEQARGVKVDARTDLFSLGVVLYEMLTGKAPFAGTTAADVIAALLEREPAPLALSGLDASETQEWIVSKALRKDRDERYQTAKELRDDLKRLKQKLERQAETSYASGAVMPESGLTTNIMTPVGERAVTTNPSEAVTTASSAEFLLTSLLQHKRGVAVSLVALLVVISALGYGAYRLLQSAPGATPPATQRALTQLTFGAGLQSEPTWSPDGRFIAYSSDRGGNFDIWVQQVSGGNPVQVTKTPAHDWQPDWSPDGNSLAFRSEREGGGLFVVPVLGGNERKVAAFGYRPQWSPDGTQLLFYSSNLKNVTAPPKIYVVGLDGAPPREVLASLTGEFPGRLRVAWHPDGQRLSLWGEHHQAGLSFWTVTLAAPASGPPVKSEFSPQVAAQIKTASVDLFDFRWARTGRALYFEGVSRGVRNLWKVEVEPASLRWTNGPERLTTGAGLDTDITLSPDGKKLAFTTRSEHTRLWSLPFNAATGQLRGAGQPVTPVGLNTQGFDLTRDGKKLVFLVQRAEQRELWEKYFADGSEKMLLAGDEYTRSAPRWSRDGLRVAYVRSRPPSPERSQQYTFNFEHAIVVLNEDSNNEQVLTAAHPRQGWPWDWTADQSAILASSGRQTPEHWGLFLFPLAAAPQAETQKQLLAARPAYDAFNARFSPDERWVCFIGVNRTDAGDAGLYAVPAQGGAWVRLTEGKFYDDKPRWSPDGQAFYFISNRSGFFNVWGRRFDPQAGQPVGEAFRVTNFESPGQMIPPTVVQIELALAADRLVAPIMEVAGSVWILENVDR